MGFLYNFVGALYPVSLVLRTEAADTGRVGVSVVSISPVQAATDKGDECADLHIVSRPVPDSVRLEPGGASTRAGHLEAY